MYSILQFMDYTIYSKVTYLFTTLTSIHSDFHNPNKLTPTSCMLTLTTLTYSLPLQLWHTHSHSNPDMFTVTTELLAHTTLTYSLSALQYTVPHSSDILTLTTLIIWCHWEQAGSSGSGVADRGEISFPGSSGFGFAGSKLVAVECSLSPLWQTGFAGSKLVAGEFWLWPLWQSGSTGSKLLAVDLASLGASWLCWIWLRG
jgi:hypothetical protein